MLTQTRPTVKLFCEEGKHYWERDAQRGAKPRNCPQHKPQVIQSTPRPKAIKGPKVETLFCESGQHSWERESKRGIKPKNCPEHSVSASSLVPREESLLRARKARAQRATEKAVERGSETIERVLKERACFPCSCGITPDMTLSELNTLGCGCTGGDNSFSSAGFVCPTLDACRRALGH